MNKNYNDLLAFVTVAQQGSFTKAAGLLGVSQSALSHTVRSLEQRLDVRLLNRTTRSVSPTEAGEKLMNSIAPKLSEIDHELEMINEFKLQPGGTIRITAAETRSKHHFMAQSQAATFAISRYQCRDQRKLWVS
ncbi:LysR family transcriptional regulator [Vibrio sp. CDRSL-10 TSBA]